MNNKTKYKIKQLKGKIFRGTSSEEEEDRYHELSGIHLSTIVRETPEQKAMWNEKNKIQRKLCQNQRMWYSVIEYPVGHTHQ